MHKYAMSRRPCEVSAALSLSLSLTPSLFLTFSLWPSLPSPLSPLPSLCSLRGHEQVLEIEIIKQAGIETYTRTFELPVGKAYKMYDSIMRGLCEKSK